MSLVLSVANQKGGVGKTTTATMLGHALALTGRRVVLLDLDPQGNATSGLGLEMADRSPAFAPPAAFRPLETTWRGVACIPAGRDLARLAPPTTALADALPGLAGAAKADLVLVDCPPSLGPLTQNALRASDAVLVPIPCEYYPLEGLVQLLGAVKAAATERPDLRVAGIVLTMVDPAADLTAEVEAEVRTNLAEPVFDTVVPRDPAVAEAPSHCQSVLDYAPRSPGARAYADLALELADRLLAD